MLFGVGNTMMGDDGIGPLVAERMTGCPGWHAADCGTAPENFTGVVRKMRPRLLVIVDAADMQLSPGEFRRIPKDSLGQAGFDTHSLPLTHIMEYLQDCVTEIILIGIQPGTPVFREGISAPVRRAGEAVADMLCRGEERQIPEYIPAPPDTGSGN